jgi:HEAT repeat protein
LRYALVVAAIAVATTAAYRTTRGQSGSYEHGRAGSRATFVKAGATRPADVQRLTERARDASDEVSRIEAIDALAAQGHLPLLPDLLAFDVAGDPFVAPTVIQAIGTIGQAAPPAEKRKALERLVSLLASEKERNGQDSAGNVVALIEAIGTLGEPSGAPALLRELEDGFHDTAGKTNIVEALAKLGAHASAPAIAKLRHHLVENPATEPFDRELEEELLAAISKLN